MNHFRRFSTKSNKPGCVNDDPFVGSCWHWHHLSLLTLITFQHITQTDSKQPPGALQFWKGDKWFWPLTWVVFLSHCTLHIPLGRMYPELQKKKKEWKKNNTHGLQGSGLTKCIGQEVEDPRSHPDPTRHVYMSCSWERNHINIQHTYGTSSHSLAEWIPTFLTFLKYLSGWKILHLRQKGNHSRVNRE